MKSLPACLVGALCAGLLSWDLQSACDAGTANFPRAEQGTPRYDYCHSLEWTPFFGQFRACGASR
jgi:hypothetical protein